jgi:hypothetical protein
MNAWRRRAWSDAASLRRSWTRADRRAYAPLVRCEECGQEADEAHAAGWVAYRVDLADDPDEPEVIVYCPECAAREFGEEIERRGG